MPAPDNILQLIDQFHSQLASYRSLQYNEAQVRNEFIEPFFAALGWDVYNKQGYAYHYKDVIYEDSIKIAAATKAPDYAFRIGGTRKFFVEAKKPSVNLKDEITPAYQLRRYAWSAKLPLSILTDFEEFAVYDCRPKPDKTDKASTGRIMMLTYLDYPSHWDEIASIFSKQAVLKGSFDHYAEAVTGKRGTSEVDDAFLAEIERWRDLLAHNIALRNPTLCQRDLNYAIQMTIDRLIFLRICEDRGIEFYGQLQSLLNGGETYARLCQLFHKADERYNSGLFHFLPERDRADSPDMLTPGLLLDDKPLKDILANLYYPDSPYAFSVLPADILGQVYERFLGKVIRLTSAHHAVVEDKPEVKKAGGVFYTPSFIVEYIVKNTLGKLLEGKIPGQVGVGKGTPLRILDMSCGSGSFLIGAYQYLLDWYLGGYSLESEKWSKGTSPRLYQISSPDVAQWKLTTSERKRILLDHIYGVDIDSQAVEVTKLSLLLKVLEGESEESIGKQLSMFHQRALPDLASNIKCGNSLIGPDFYANQPAQQGTLPGFDQEEQYRINAFDWHAEFPHVFCPSARLCWLVTFVTHNSRISERMVTYGVKSGDPLVLDAPDRLLIAQYISDATRSHTIPVIAWNVLPDHVHMVLAAQDERELDEQVRKIKGFSSFSFQRARGLDAGGHVWAQKYHHLLITDQRMLESVYAYVMDNHIKHAEQWGHELIDMFEAPLFTPPATSPPATSPPAISPPATSPPATSPPTISPPAISLPATSPPATSPPATPTRGLSPLLHDPSSGPLSDSSSGPLSDSSSSPLSDSSSGPLSDSSSSPLSLRVVRDELCVTPEQACQPLPGGFDVIIGNPPYIRIQSLKELAPRVVKFYKQHYHSASKGNYDIYVMFVEKGLSLLNQNGLFGYILPSKFFATDYGEYLRKIIADKQSISRIVDFGHMQVFEQAATYTCLLFLSGSSKPTFEYIKVVSPKGLAEQINFRNLTNSMTSTPWVFEDGFSSTLSQKISACSKPLGELPTRIARGSSSGADQIYIIKREKDCYLTQHGENIEIEAAILRTPVYATSFGRYEFRPKSTEAIIFPYRVRADGYDLITEDELRKDFPYAYRYLASHRKELEARKQYKTWFSFSAPRNLDVHNFAQILVPLLANRGLFCRLPEDSSDYCLMASGGFSITVNQEGGLSPNYVLGLLNSRLLFWRLRTISNIFRGGWITCTKQYVETIPIHKINFTEHFDVQCYDQMVTLVEHILSLHQQLASSNTPTEKTLLQRQIDTTDRQIDALVYELYDLTDEDIRFVEEL
jgi:REP element-mobilizing transposase RayT